MKLSRIPAMGVAAALVASSALLIAGPAAAETQVGDAYFYADPDFGHEPEGGGGYPATDWFFGDVTGTEGAHTFGIGGLAVNDGSAADGDVQILGTELGTLPTDAAGLATLIDNTEVYAYGAGWTFQLPLFAEAGETGFTTLRPDTAGTNDTANSQLWITSQAIAPTVSFPAGFAAEATATFTDFATAIFEGTAPTILAQGLFFRGTDTTTVAGISFNGLTSFFGPVPTRTIAPNPVTPAEASTAGQGIHFVGTGWLPGSEVYIAVEDAEGNDLYFNSSAYIVDETGAVNFTVVLDAVPPLGTYTVYFDDDDIYWDENVFPTLELVVSNAPALAATGVDSTSAIVGGASLLLLGGVLAVVAVRRRSAVQA